MKIRFTAPATARLNFQPGDEVHVGTVTPDVQALLNSRRINNLPVCEVIHETAEAHDPLDGDERAVAAVGSRRRSGGR